MINLVLFFYLVSTFFLLLSLFVWHSFPATYVANTTITNQPRDVILESSGHSTPFFQIITALTTIGFAAAVVLLVVFRNEFKGNVCIPNTRSFAYITDYLLFTTLLLRVLNTAIAVTVVDTHSRGLQIFASIIRLLSFTFLFLTIVVSTLKYYEPSKILLINDRNPMDTLYRRIYVNQYQLENQKKFAEWMIDQLPVIVMLLDADGTIRHMNRTAKQAFSYTKDDTIGESFFTLCIHVNDSQHHEQIFKEALTKGTSEGNMFKLSSMNPKDESKQYEWSCNVMHTEFLVAPFKYALHFSLLIYQQIRI